MTDRYDIQAKASQPAGHDEMMTMLRSLLRDRFGLRVARESRPTQGFALQVDPARDKLVPSQDGSPAQPLRFSPLGIGGKGIPLSELASMLSRYMGVPVVDETGRGGRFDFDVRIETEPGINFMTPPFLEVLRRSVEAQLGLRFRERTLTEDVIVIEEIHRPSPN